MRRGAKDLTKIFSGIVLTVTPIALAAQGCTLGNQNLCSGSTAPLPDPVTVKYTPPVCTVPEASDVSDASDAEATAEAGDGGDDDASASDAGSPGDTVDASFDAGPPVCSDNAMCQRVCPEGWWGPCARGLNDAGEDVVTCTVQPSAHCGRRFAGLRGRAHTGATALGAFFAGTAYLEEASITAFEILAKELSTHGAPRALVAEAKRSAEDERRHTRAMTALAKRHGGKTRAVAKQRTSRRPLSAMLRENAVEGCVRETYGALVATFQATNATCPKTRAAMKKIARDETRHAVLAWKIDAWANENATAKERDDISRARKQAVRKLAKELAAPLHSSLTSEAGMPTPAQAHSLLTQLVIALEV